jgi:hypothetical protein
MYPIWTQSESVRYKQNWLDNLRGVKDTRSQNKLLTIDQSEDESMDNLSPFKTVKVKVTLRLAAYRQSVRLGVKPIEIHDQRFLFYN